MTDTQIIFFRNKKIRRELYHAEWYFSVVDIIETLTDSSFPRRYWSDLKIKIKKEGYKQLYDKIVRLKLTSSDGKQRETDCADTETMLRIIQTIPSLKSEPMKRWLARVVEKIIGRSVATRQSLLK